MSWTLHDLLGTKEGSLPMRSWLSFLTSQNTSDVDPVIKSYPGTAYHNYPALGLSLEYKQVAGEQRKTGQYLDAIHIYNSHEPRSKHIETSPAYEPFPLQKQPMFLKKRDGNPETFEIRTSTTAKEFVEALGEPSRKGGGQGPSTGSINIWCEWTNIGVMIEFGGAGARGPQAWDQGQNAVWKEMIVFKPQNPQI